MFIKRIYHSKFFSIIFPTLVYCLQNELKDCETVLDLGCGPSSPLQFCKNIKYSLGVEAFKPYLKKTKEKGIHTEYLNEKIEKLNFPEKSFDAVIMIEVLEHLPETGGLQILARAEKWAKKKVIVSSPNGFVPQKEVDQNPYQKHLSGWDYKKMKNLGFRVKGLAGLKILRQEVQDETMGDNLMTSIKYRPRFFWFLIAALSQSLTYHFPRLSFELLSVKKKRLLLLSRPIEGFKHVYSGEQSVARSIYFELKNDFKVDPVRALLIPPHSSLLSLIFYDWIYPFCLSFKNFFNGYPVVVFNAPFQASAIDLFKIGGSKTVVLIHDLFFLDNKLKSLHDRYSYWLYQRVLNRADFIVANTEEIAIEIKKNFGLSSKAIYLGTTSEFNSFSEKEIKRKKISFCMGYIGAYENKRKRVNKIFELITKNRQHKLKYCFAGPITEEFKRGLEKIKTPKVSYRIYGLIEEKDKPNFFRDFCFFYFPSRLEGTGLPLIESFKSGVLPIVHEDAKIPEMIKKKCIVVKDTDEVISQVSSYIRNPEKFRAFALRNYKESRIFDYKNFSDFIKNIF